MRLLSKKVSVIIVAAALLVYQLLIPVSNASAGNSTDLKMVKEFFYAYAMYECLSYSNNDDAFEPNLSFGDSMSKILKYDPVSEQVNAGAVVGYTTCLNAFGKLIGANSIQQADIEAGGLLEGVYARAMSSDYNLTCEYAITNSEGRDFNRSSSGDVMIYKFPAGWDTFEQHLSAPTITMKYNDSGYLGHTGGPADMYPKFDDEIKSSINWDKSNLLGVCKDIISYIPVYPYESEGTTYYEELNSTDDVNPFDEAWIFDGRDKNSAVIVNSNSGAGNYFKAVSEQIPGEANSIQFQTGGGSQLRTNIANKYFGGKTPKEAFESDASLQYVFYGRVVYNGDGQFTSGCKGISVDASDPRISELDNKPTWNPSLSFIKTTQAYPASGTEKKQYRTKIGTTAISGEGKDEEILVFPRWTNSGSDMVMKCSDIITKFNGLTISGDATAQQEVDGFIRPITVDEALAGEQEDPPGGNPDDPDDPDNPDDPGQDDNDEEDCYTNAGSLGWIVCPILNGSKEFIQSKYKEMVVPALQINTGLFTGDRSEQDGVYSAWSVFVQIGNILFMLLFIFVIYSQITGVSADRYGLKRMFPKLLVGVVLINLSFIICELAIDVGNIAGRSIGSLFEGIRQNVQIQPSYQVDIGGGEMRTVGDMAWSSFISSGWNPAIIALVGIIGAIVVVSQGWAILIPVLLALISIAFAIVGLIVILGIRQAAAVLLVVASPVAFACYILPNTKSIFDKWFKAFEGLLLAFPICSALVYGGDLVGAILLNASNGQFWLLVSAAAVCVAPIFFIPKVIRQSMGAISMGISRFSNRGSNRLRGMANNRLQRSALTNRRDYNRHMREQKAQARTGDYNAKRGRRIINKYGGRNPANMSAAQRRKYNVAMGAVNAQNQSLEEAYRTDFRSKDDSEIASRLIAAGRSGKLDENMLVGGLSAFQHDSQLTSAFRQLSGTDGYQKLMAKNPALLQRVGNTMASRGGSVINQSIGRSMINGNNLTSDASGNWSNESLNSIRTQVQGAGTGIMASQSKEAFNTEGAADFFSDDQLRAAAAAGYSGETAESFSNMMGSKVSTDRKQNIVSHMTAQQVSSLTSGPKGSLAAVGGADTVKHLNPSAIRTLNSDDGKDLRTRMDGSVMTDLGITGGS